jgi:hypothetical protein
VSCCWALTAGTAERVNQGAEDGSRTMIRGERLVAE